MHAMHGVTKQFRASSPFRRVVVQEVGPSSSTVLDLMTNNPFQAINLSPSGRKPEIGDVWMMSTETGQWSFSHLLIPASNNRLVTSPTGLVTALDNRNEINWAPFENPLAATPEAMGGAFIGEHRYFEVQPDSRIWVKGDGSAVSRKRYRPLFELIGTLHGPGDGATTFNVPFVPSPSSARQLVQTTTKTMSGDYTYTTAAATLSGLSHTLTVPATVDPTNWVARVHIAVGVVTDSVVANNVWATVAAPYLDGVAWNQDGQPRHLEWQSPVTSTLWTTLSTTWEFTFTTTGSHTITARGFVASTSSTLVAKQNRSTMVIDEFYRDDQVVDAGWYIRAA